MLNNYRRKENLLKTVKRKKNIKKKIVIKIYENCVKYYENLKDTFTDFIKSSFLLNLFILNRYLKQTK